VRPPLTLTVWPVTKDASSEARNATTLATSAGRPSRRKGIALVSVADWALLYPPHFGVDQERVHANELSLIEVASCWTSWALTAGAARQPLRCRNQAMSRAPAPWPGWGSEFDTQLQVAALIVVGPARLLYDSIR
jgi:hypothetical protein